MLIESLERRQLLSASAVELPCGILIVRADNSGDNLTIIENAHIAGYNRAVQVFQDSNQVGGLFTDVNKIVVLGGNGADTINVSTQDVGSYIDGGNGNDSITLSVNPDDFDLSLDGLVFHQEYTGGCNEIFGGNGDDIISASGVRDTQISGGNGNDQITVIAVITSGDNQPGTVVGGENILINGDNGDDIIAATDVTCSIVSGDNGNDTIVVRNSAYTLILGGNGADNINETAGSNDVIDGGNGKDIISVNASNGDHVIRSAGGDIVTCIPPVL